MLFSQVIEKIHDQASSITFDMIAPSDADLLVRDELDLMIVPERYIIPGHPSQLLFEEEYVCVVRQGNTLVGDHLSHEQYMELGHITVWLGRTRHLSIEDWFMNQYAPQHGWRPNAPLVARTDSGIHS